MKELLKMWLTNLSGIVGFFLTWIGGGYLISFLGSSYAISLGLSTLIVGIITIFGVVVSSKLENKDILSNRFTEWKLLFMIWVVPTFIGGGFYLLMCLGTNYIVATLIPM